MDYLVLKRTAEAGLADDWTPVTIAHVDGEDSAAAVLQGYTGDGRYKAIVWPAVEGSEFDLGPHGPPVATPASEEAAPERAANEPG
jgi:hypothetical protein